MTDTELATLSTIAWLIVTTALFVALAQWSAGNGSWTIVPGFVRGVREWVAGPPTTGTASSSPGAFVLDTPRLRARDEPCAEIEDL